MNLLQALKSRADQERRALAAGRLGLGENPDEGPGVPVGKVPVVGGPALLALHALGLAQEAGSTYGKLGLGATAAGLGALRRAQASPYGGAVNAVAQTVPVVGAVANALQLGRHLGPLDPLEAGPLKGADADRALAAFLAHPGFAGELAANEELAHTNKFASGVGAEMANPLNLAGAAAEVPGVLGRLGVAGNVVNEAPFLPLKAALAARRAQEGERAAAASGAVLRAVLGQPAPATDAGAIVRKALGDTLDSPAGYRPANTRIGGVAGNVPRQELPLLFGKRQVGPALPPGPLLPSTVVRPAPQSQVPRLVRPAPQEQVARLVRAAPQTGVPPLPPEVYLREPTFRFGPPSVLQEAAQRRGVVARPSQAPNSLDDLLGAARGTMPDTPPTDVPARTEAVDAPQAVPTVADLGGDISREGVIQATANRPPRDLTPTLRSLHNAVYPGGQRDFAIPSLTGVGARDFRTSWLTDHPTGNAAEQYLDYLVSRVQADTKAAARLADLDPGLAADVAALPPHPTPVSEQKVALQRRLGAGKFTPTAGGRDIPTNISALTPEATNADIPAAFDAILASGDNGRMSGELPAGTAFWEKRLGVGPARARALLDGAVADGRLGVGPDGALRFRPRALSNVDIAPNQAPLAVSNIPEQVVVPEPTATSTTATDAELLQRYGAEPEPGDFFPPDTRRAVVFGKEGSYNKRKQFSANYHPVGDYDIHAPELTVRQSYQDPKLWDVVNKAGSRGEQVLARGLTKAKAKEIATFALEHHPPLEYGTHGKMDFTEEVMQDLIAKRTAALAPPPTPGGDIAAGGGGGGGLGIASPVANRAGEALGGAVAGGVLGGAVGGTQGDTAEERTRNAIAGVGAGLLVGGNVGVASPELLAAARQLAPLTKGTMLSPTMARRIFDAGLAGQAESVASQGVRGAANLIKAAPGAWREQAVMTAKQLPMDALNRWVTLWGIARKELGVTDGDIARWQELLADERATGVSSLDNPVTDRLRRIGLQRLLPPDKFREVYGTDFVSSVAGSTGRPRLSARQNSALGAIFSGYNGTPTINPLSIVAGGVKGRFQGFVTGAVGFANAVQHDAFRGAMAEKTLDRDIPALARALTDDLAARGADVSPLVAKGGYFSGDDVAAVAGPALGKQWDQLLEETVRNGGDRIAFLAGDFREASQYRIEDTAGKVFPFIRWPLHYGPVFAEIAANHPRLAAVAAGILAQQQQQAQQAGLKAYETATVPITTETPVLGAYARLRLGGQAGTVRANPLGAVVPYSQLAGGVTMPEGDDANLYQQAKAVGEAVGATPNPLVGAAAYATGLDYQAPGPLSRTAGLEGLAGLLPGAAGRLRAPSLRGGLDALREQVTGQPAPAFDPTYRRYAELVLDRTGKTLDDQGNRAYLRADTPEARALFAQAKREVLLAGAAGNATSLTSPVSVTARGADAQASAAARGTMPYTYAQMQAASPGVALQMQQANVRYVAQHPEAGAYQGANPGARADTLIRLWEVRAGPLKKANYAAWQRARQQELDRIDATAPR